MKREVNAHRMIADLCVEMANEVYETCATLYNNWHKLNPSRKRFVKECAPTLIEDARRTLAEMLGRHDVSDADKEKIYEALMLDMTIPQADTRARWNPQVIAQASKEWLN